MSDIADKKTKSILSNFSFCVSLSVDPWIKLNYIYMRQFHKAFKNGEPMLKHITNFRYSLVSKLIITVGITMLLGISIWAYFSIKYQKKKITESTVSGADRLSTTIKLGTHYAMMLNSRDDINQIIQNIGKQKEIENIRIYNKEGEIKFSNKTSEVNLVTNIKAEACDICHRSEPPTVDLSLDERIRIFDSKKGYRLLGIISPIYNEPG
ncbi:MAG: hypothetical protein U9R43_08410, partial [Thermodesulfobacteriota bacterium]|nr:hypothetical protein [Thermodesulfobacteriota bacterium]